MPGCPGSQKISRRLRATAMENVEEWDIENAHFAIASQIPERVGFKLDHPVTKLPGITAYVNNRENVLAETARNREEAKTMLLSTLNGARVREEMAKVEILRQIQQESKFLRWVARSLQPCVYEACCRSKDKPWPEATTLTYTFEGADVFILQAIHTCVRTHRPA